MYNNMVMPSSVILDSIAMNLHPVHGATRPLYFCLQNLRAGYIYDARPGLLAAFYYRIQVLDPFEESAHLLLYAFEFVLRDSHKPSGRLLSSSITRSQASSSQPFPYSGMSSHSFGKSVILFRSSRQLYAFRSSSTFAASSASSTSNISLSELAESNALDRSRICCHLNKELRCWIS